MTPSNILSKNLKYIHNEAIENVFMLRSQSFKSIEDDEFHVVVRFFDNQRN